MTKVVKKVVKCNKCGTESEQLIIYSVNFNLGNNKSNEELLNYLQKCPKCGYKAVDISKSTN